ncbi:MAG: hypothetical protein Q9213_006811 [Squamulea squamosa]
MAELNDVQTPPGRARNKRHRSPSRSPGHEPELPPIPRIRFEMNTSLGHLDPAGAQNPPGAEPPLDSLQDLNFNHIDDFAYNMYDPKLLVNVNLRVDKVMVLSRNYTACSLSEFNIEDIEKDVLNTIQQKGGNDLGWEIKSIIVLVKAKNRQATNKSQLIEELSLVEWVPVSELILRESKAFLSKVSLPQVDVIVNIRAEADKELLKAYRQAAALAAREGALTPEAHTIAPTPVGRPRNTRSLQQLANANATVNDDEEVGKFNKQLVDRWRCIDERCPNSTGQRGYCYIDGAGDHYNMTAGEQMKWAKAIQQREPNIDLEHPPRSLYILWTRSNGPINSSSKRPIKAQQRAEERSIMEQIKEMQQQELEEKLYAARMAQLDRMGNSTNPVANSQ